MLLKLGLCSAPISYLGLKFYLFQWWTYRKILNLIGKFKRRYCFSVGKYGDDLNESSESVKHLRTVLTQFTSDERSRFLRFVTGRKRPPAPFTVAKAGGEKDSLPHASTCASTLFLPDYSSASAAKEKLRLAKKTKVINLANHKDHRQSNELEANIWSLREARENVRATRLVLVLPSDWLTKNYARLFLTNGYRIYSWIVNVLFARRKPGT